MPLPRLIHPTPVYLRKIDRKFTAKFDDNLREPVGQVRRDLKPIKLYAQVKIGNTGDPNASVGGIVEESQGYLLFRLFDLKAAHVEIERGDRIVQIGEGVGERQTDLYITKLIYLGHYPKQRGPTLVKAFFEDRKPSRQRGDL